MPERLYEKLIAWKESFSLCLNVYQITRSFPSDERFVLTQQMRRSAGSVPTNIAEGNVKRSAKEKAHFFEIALASLEELHCQYRIALGLGYIDQQKFNNADSHIHRVGYLIHQLRFSVISRKSLHSLISLPSLHS